MWSAATHSEIDGFKFWRMTDVDNPQRVAGASVLDNLTAISCFYEWAATRYDVANPVARHHLRGRRRERVAGFEATPHALRDRDVKWLDPGGYALWRDLGLRGLDRDGREVDRWRGRNSQRDCAFADGLYGTGLRLTEWASLLMTELPADDPGRGFSTCWLASACAKNERGRRYWMPRQVLADVLAYVEVERAAAVRRAQQAGRYDKVADVLVLRRVMARRRVELADALGAVGMVSLDVLDPAGRARVFVQTSGGLAPAALWLNEDGLPRRPHGWEHTFDVANQRVARTGLASVRATAHMLRHSFALRWFSVGRLLYERRFSHLDADELRDFRAQFGDTWYLVKTLLGHADVSTTMNVYLEPFRDLDVALLIEHAHGAMVSALMAEMFAAHPQVVTVPEQAGAEV
jgi:site-specific recombinase XerD